MEVLISILEFIPFVLFVVCMYKATSASETINEIKYVAYATLSLAIVTVNNTM
jgi:uncharacterized membrane protein